MKQFVMTRYHERYIVKNAGDDWTVTVNGLTEYVGSSFAHCISWIISW